MDVKKVIYIFQILVKNLVIAGFAYFRQCYRHSELYDSSLNIHSRLEHLDHPKLLNHFPDMKSKCLTRR